MASRILGMGDVLTLIEKAQEAFDEKKAEKLVKRKLRTNASPWRISSSQMQPDEKDGRRCSDMLSMLPGVGSKLQDVEIDENADEDAAGSHHPLHDPARSAGTPASSTPAAASASRRAAAPPCRTSTAAQRSSSRRKDMMKQMMGSKLGAGESALRASKCPFAPLNPAGESHRRFRYKSITNQITRRKQNHG